MYEKCGATGKSFHVYLDLLFCVALEHCEQSKILLQNRAPWIDPIPIACSPSLTNLE